MNERSRLARRAEGGDVEAARRLLELNEGSEGSTAEGPVSVRGRWEFWRRLDGGHKVFRDALTGRWAIADDSGDMPDETDDGIIWIDPTQPARVGRWRSGGQPISIHGDAERRQATTFMEPTAGLLWLAARFGIEIDTPEGRFIVRRVADSPLERKALFSSIMPVSICIRCGIRTRLDEELCRQCEEGYP